MSWARGLGRDFLHLWTTRPWQEGPGSWPCSDRLQTSIQRHYVMVHPNGISAHTRLDKLVSLEGHYKSQGLAIGEGEPSIPLSGKRSTGAWKSRRRAG